MSKVELYVYDLSRGMAKSLSLALTGKQIDGIWHTSVVVFGREIFFGQGIMEAKPGTTHHGQPVQIIDCGVTEIDQATFQEYLTSLQDMYTPSAYHLIEFNCNHFTGDVVGFLTGREIPSWISGLPTEFLSTPFGQAMRPQIDAMFRKTAPSEHLVASHASSTSSGSNILNTVATQATLTSPLTLVSSVTNFNSILKQHSAVIANFTNTSGCAPCRAIKPVYESLASEYTKNYGERGARFVEIELGIGEGQDLARNHGVQATPTFIFFKDGKKAGELKGASKRELELKVDDFLEECFPRHPHKKLYLPAIEGISTAPITSNQVPAYPALLTKLGTFGVEDADLDKLRSTIPKMDVGVLTPITEKAMDQLEPEQTFPLVDLWRVGLLDGAFCEKLVAIPDIVKRIISTAAQTPGASKPYILTVLRFLTNLTASSLLANVILSPGHPEVQSDLVTVLVDALLHADPGVRSTAGNLAVNLAGWRHRSGSEVVEVEWEVEIVSALLEGIGREQDEEVAYRLMAALGLMIWLSPTWEYLQSLLQVLDARGKIRSRVYKKKELKRLAEEISSKLID